MRMQASITQNNDARMSPLVSSQHQSKLTSSGSPTLLSKEWGEKS